MPTPPSLLRTLVRPFLPPVETARRYSFFKLRKDLLAGLTVSAVEVPQAMAYAVVAGVPPVYGIYTSIIQGALGALFSSSQHMATGPTNTQSLLVASALQRIVAPDAPPQRYLELVFALTLLKGLIQLAFAAARMGNLVRYVSRSVIVGLVSGAGILIFFGQLPAFLGIEAGDGADAWPGIIAPIARLVRHADEANLRAAGVGAIALALILGLQLANRFLPASLLAVIASGVAVWLLRWGPADLPLIHPLPPSLPSFALPRVEWRLIEQLLAGALALAVIGMLETVAIAKGLAAHGRTQISANQEFFNQGLTNFLSSFWQCIPGSGSFTRSALDYSSGAQTRFAAVFNAVFVAAIFLMFGRLAGYVPRAALAAVLFVIVFGLIDWRYIVRLARTSGSDTLVCAVTLIATLVAPLQYAIFLGIFLNIALYLRKASRLHLHEMIQAPGGPFLETPIHDRSGNKQVIFLQVEGDLFFGVADELQDRLAALTRSAVRVVILRLKRTHSLDATVLHVLEQFALAMHERGGHVILCGIKPELMRVFERYGLVSLIGRENLFETGGGVFQSAKQALRRAKELASSSIDTKPMELAVEEEGITYEI